MKNQKISRTYDDFAKEERNSSKKYGKKFLILLDQKAKEEYNRREQFLGTDELSFFTKHFADLIRMM